MKRYDCAQGGTAWLQARLGVVTASQFHRILTPTLKASTSARHYAHELLAEVYLGEDQGSAPSDEWMIRGTSMEAEAVRWYEMQREVECETVGFLTTDDGRVGCSPDRLVGTDGGLEIKCPSAKVHVGYLLGEDAHAHRCQVQGSLWVTGRKWWDLLIYSPVLPPSLKRHEVDPEWVEAWEDALAPFLGLLSAGRATLDGMGMAAAQARTPPAEDLWDIEDLLS